MQSGDKFIGHKRALRMPERVESLVQEWKYRKDRPRPHASAHQCTDFVQENGPENSELKIKLFAEMDDATPSDSIIASSSSGITMSVIQSGCRHPERCVIGHPFNPPHLRLLEGTKHLPKLPNKRSRFMRL